MKHSFFLLILAFILISCNNSVDPESSVIPTGTVHKLRASTWMYGTHTLNDLNGSLLYSLKSSTVDLDLYDNKQVEILGNLIPGYPVDGGPKYLNVISVIAIK